MINTAIYGNSGQWANCSYQPTVANSSYRNKKAYMTGTTATTFTAQLQRAVAAGTLHYGVMPDMSICFSALGAESPLATISTARKVSGNIVTESEITKTVKKWFLWEKTNDYPANANRGSLRLDNTATYLWATTTNISNIARYAEPFTSLYPKNQVLLIRVVCGMSDFTNTQDVDLNTYCTTTYIDHPIIYSVYADFYAGNATPRNTNAWSRPEADRRGYMFGFLSNITVGNTNYINLCPTDVTGGNLHIKSGYLPLYGSFDNHSSHFYSSTELPIFCGNPADFNTVAIDSTSMRIYHTLTDITTFKQKMLKACACYGLFFTDAETTAINGAYNDSNMYVGLLDHNGIGHGNYVKGTDNESAPQYTWSDMHQSGYNPPTGVDPTIYDNTTILHFNRPSTSFAKSWVLTRSDVDKLYSNLYNATSDVQQGQSIVDHNYQIYLTSDPVNCIVSLMQYPIDSIPSIGIPDYIKFGTYTSDIQALPLAWQCAGYSFSFNKAKNNTLYPIYGDFRDYEPYTKCTLSIPFCGSIDIPCDYIYKYDDLTVTVIIDFVTGTCTALVLVNGDIINAVSGVAGQTMPLSGVQTATLNAQIQNIAQQDNKRLNTLGASLVAGSIAIGTAILSGGTTAVLAGLAGLATVATAAANAGAQKQQIDYDLQHMQTPIKMVSAASAGIAQSMDLRCRLLISRPVMSDDYDSTIYADTVGFACLINTTVNQLHGLTVGNIDLDGVPATAAEKDYIRQAFVNGVYL